MDEPIHCRITVRGTVSPGWSDRLGGMRIVPGLDDAGNPITTLVGNLPDQAAVTGVINTLYQLRLPLLNVSQREMSPEGEPPTDGEGTSRRRS